MKSIVLSLLIMCSLQQNADSNTWVVPLHVMKRRSSPFAHSRTEYSGAQERALGIDGLPDPFVHSNEEPQRSLQDLMEIPLGGDDACPCIDLADAPSMNYTTDLSTYAQGELANQNITSYGYGCLQHDLKTVSCVEAQAAGNRPLWCSRQWCWIDRMNCSLVKRDSGWVPGKTYSYAACRKADEFLTNELISSLKGLTLKVGFDSNSGGWRGGYFNETLNKWYGPIVEFVKASSEFAGFEIEHTVPPQELRSRSDAFFNNSSPFDFCVYATALGILDFCVSQYTVTTRRALDANWIITSQEDVWLVTQVQGIVVVTDWASLVAKFNKSFDIITQPFEKGTWNFLIFCFVPLMGIMFIIHEYGQPGSSFQVGETEEEEDEDGTMKKVAFREISIWEHVGTGLYNSFLSVLQGGYEETVVTHGGFIHLLGVSFFIMTIIAVYTANMAAILTDRATQGDVKTIIGALRENYRFCADRSTMQLMMKSYPRLLPATQFVNDPKDGMPGFVDNRTLTLDNLDVDRANSNASYCHAAMMVKQDLEYEQGQGRHCDKTIVGNSLAIQVSGMPLSARYSRNLKALFSKMINLNTLELEVRQGRPPPDCSAVESQIRGEEKSLSIEQLAGVWFVTFGFAVLGLAMHYFKPWARIKVPTRKERKKKKADKKRMEKEEKKKRKKEKEREEEQSIGADELTAISGASPMIPQAISWKSGGAEDGEETQILIPDYVLELSQFSHLFLELEDEEVPSCPTRSNLRASWRASRRR